jgi:hypothetical protein
MGFVFAGVAGAQQIEAVRIVESSSNWPWVALSLVVGLLGVISFASRRRIYASVGS